jgi:NAD(P)H-hydrate epimerase
MSLPALTREMAREIDRRAIEEYGMSSLVLMENAGRGAVDTLFELGVSGRVVIVCGRGNNAGDGLVMARHLDIRRANVHVILLADPRELSGDARTNYDILRKSDVPIEFLAGPDLAAQLATHLTNADWIVDALLGTGARGEPREPLAMAIDILNAASGRKLAVDLPSGLDCDTGFVARHTFRADHTCTFVAAKQGFFAPRAGSVTGTVHVVDIGVPRKLVSEILSIP